MRKVWVIAAREYNAAVRTKAFLISLLIMPILMGGSLLVQMLTRNAAPTEVKHYAVLDLSDGSVIYPLIRQKVVESVPPELRGNITVEQVEPADTTPSAVSKARESASERTRRGELIGFVEIPADVFQLPKQQHGGQRAYPPLVIHYRTNRVLDPTFATAVQQIVKEQVMLKRGEALGLKGESVQQLTAGIDVQTGPPLRRDDVPGAVQEAQAQEQLAAFLVPFLLMMLMFMIVMMTSTPLMQAVLEEKMQRIAEVLLGSVRPFPLMLGKLLGMTGVSLTVSAVYLGGAWWAANRFGFAEHVSAWLLGWFVLFQALASLMFGSLFIAIGAAASDMKETQSLLWPIMILICLPFFVMTRVIQEPNGTLVTGMSFFPFATPSLMIGRMGIPPGVPDWQLYAGVAVVLATTLLCVWAAGRIFRVGILMQGKGARLSDLARWVLRG
jgi:ABC-2 type transport system permease protein